MSEIKNRYGAQNILYKGEACCCHKVPLSEACSGCTALEETKRQPTLVGVGHDEETGGRIVERNEHDGYVEECVDLGPEED